MVLEEAKPALRFYKDFEGKELAVLFPEVSAYNLSKREIRAIRKHREEQNGSTSI
ncbi:MAG: hypothetical protein RRZ33_05650 [Lachnospiraceae bacterium]